MTMKTFHEDLWQFPCELNVKAMGLSEHPLAEIISEIAQAHCTHVDLQTLAVKESRTGKYKSISLTVTLANKEQGESLYLALGNRSEIKWTL